ncbi:MAG: hypothetical protein GC161_17220 [Planctomycetaceae bacterium]|nr:hypothetical protein [Planctomycetaceae bacterium]
MRRTVWGRLFAALLVLVALLLLLARLDRVAVEPAAMAPAALDARVPLSEPLVAERLAGPSEIDAESGGGDTRASVEATLRVRAEFVGGSAAERARVEVWVQEMPQPDDAPPADGLSDAERAALGVPLEPRPKEDSVTKWVPLRRAELGDNFSVHVGNQSELGEPPLVIQAYLKDGGFRAVSGLVHLGSWPSDPQPLRCEFSSGVRVRALHPEGGSGPVEILAFPVGHLPTAHEIEAARAGEQGLLLHRVTSVGEWTELPLPTGTSWRLVAGRTGLLAFDADAVLVAAPGANRELPLQPVHAASYVLVDEQGTRIRLGHAGDGAAVGEVRLGHLGGEVPLSLGLLAGLRRDLAQPKARERSTVVARNIYVGASGPKWSVAAKLMGYEQEVFSVPFVSPHLCGPTELTLRPLEGPLGEVRLAVHGSDALRRVSEPMALWMVRADGTERIGPIPLPWPWQGELAMPWAESGAFLPELHWRGLRTAPGRAVEFMPGRSAAVEFDLRESVATLELVLPPEFLRIGQTVVLELQPLGTTSGGSEFLAAYAVPGESPVLGPFAPGEYEARLFEPVGLVPTDMRPAPAPPFAPGEPPSWRFHATGGAHLVFALH